MEERSINEQLTKVSVGSPERAASVEVANKAAEALTKLMTADTDTETKDDVWTAVTDESGSAGLVVWREKADEPDKFRKGEMEESDSTERIVIKNNRTPVSITVPAGKNAMTGAPSKLVISFEAHEVQISEDFISVLYKHSFTLLPPAFTPVTLKVDNVTYNVMSMNASRKLGPLTDINFVIVRSQNGKESDS